MSLKKSKNIKIISLLTVFMYAFSLFSGLIPDRAAFAATLVLPVDTANQTSASETRPIPAASAFFAANIGQKGDKVSYYADLPIGTMFVSREGELVYSLFKTDTNSTTEDKPTLQGWTLKETLVNANKIKTQGQKELKARVNYFIGNNQAKWQREIKTYGGLSLGEVYPGIEVSLSINDNNVEKIFKVLPGADAGQIRVQIDGSGTLSVDENGQLAMLTGLGPVAFTKPVAYQEKNGEVEYIPVKYKLDQNTYGFEVGEYDKTLPLIIDPLLAATYFGSYSYPHTIKVSDSGEIYIGGNTLNTSFPTTVGAYDTTHNAYYDAFVSKFSSDLSTLISSTYIGGGSGNSGEDNCTTLDIDSSGNVFIAGATNSSNFPTTAGSFDETHNGDFDVFVAKLDTDLSNLLSSTYIGNANRDQAEDLAIDKTGNVYIAGTAVGGYPTTQGVYDPTANGYNDVFITKLDSSLTTILASTFIGARYDDNGKALAIDSAGNIYVTGSTFNSSFPTTSGAYSRTHSGGILDIFVAKFSPDLINLLASTFVGGSKSDSPQSLSLDDMGNVYIGGGTDSLNYP
ncbi:MAG TPA: SBBP repeat-containing protein, partial [Desulfobacteria bacterium]|nr:SBBP repeat-containing protein [Desulfobacteria bacterium]